MKWRSRIQVPVRTQLSHKVAHPKKRMRKRGLYPAIAIAFLVLLFLTGGAASLRDSAVFYARVVRLYTEDPDTRLAMPVKDISKKHVADT